MPEPQIAAVILLWEWLDRCHHDATHVRRALAYAGLGDLEKATGIVQCSLSRWKRELELALEGGPAESA